MFGIMLNSYTIDNYKANSCFINLIVDTWHEAFEIRKKDKHGKDTRKFAALTYESVCSVIGLTFKDQDIGASIRESVKFFEKFRLGLDVVNVFGELLFSYRPKELNTNIRPQVLRMCVHNNHCYKLDGSLESKIAKLRESYNQKIQLDEISSLTVSNSYKLRSSLLDDSEIYFIDKLDKYIRSAKESKIRFITNSNLTDILFEMRNANYTPNACFGGNKLLSLSFKVGKVRATIENSDNTAPDDTIMELDNKELYEEYHKADDEFYNKILKESLKSCYRVSIRH